MTEKNEHFADLEYWESNFHDSDEGDEFEIVRPSSKSKSTPKKETNEASSDVLFTESSPTAQIPIAEVAANVELVSNYPKDESTPNSRLLGLSDDSEDALELESGVIEWSTEHKDDIDDAEYFSVQSTESASPEAAVKSSNNNIFWSVAAGVMVLSTGVASVLFFGNHFEDTAEVDAAISDGKAPAAQPSAPEVSIPSGEVSEEVSVGSVDKNNPVEDSSTAVVSAVEESMSIQTVSSPLQTQAVPVPTQTTITKSDDVMSILPKLSGSMTPTKAVDLSEPVVSEVPTSEKTVPSVGDLVALPEKKVEVVTTESAKSVVSTTQKKVTSSAALAKEPVSSATTLSSAPKVFLAETVTTAAPTTTTAASSSETTAAAESTTTTAESTTSTVAESASTTVEETTTTEAPSVLEKPESSPTSEEVQEIEEITSSAVLAASDFSEEVEVVKETVLDQAITEETVADQTETDQAETDQTTSDQTTTLEVEGISATETDEAEDAVPGIAVFSPFFVGNIDVLSEEESEENLDCPVVDLESDEEELLLDLEEATSDSSEDCVVEESCVDESNAESPAPGLVFGAVLEDLFEDSEPVEC